MSDELKPCPFCGEPGKFTYYNGGWPDTCHDTECSSWKCPSRSAGRPTKEAAAALWNTRADAKVIEAAVAENERLKDVLDSIDIYLSDTLSGRVKPDPETYTEWLIDGIKIARDRARDRDWFPDHDASAALAKGGEA